MTKPEPTNPLDKLTAAHSALAGLGAAFSIYAVALRGPGLTGLPERLDALQFKWHGRSVCALALAMLEAHEKDDDVTLAGVAHELAERLPYWLDLSRSTNDDTRAAAMRANEECGAWVDARLDHYMQIGYLSRYEKRIERRDQAHELALEASAAKRPMSARDYEAASLILALEPSHPGGSVLVVKDRLGAHPRRCGYVEASALLAARHHAKAKAVEPCPDGDACPDAHRHGKVHPEPLEKQIDRLANWFLMNAPTEITEGGAVDVAIRTLEKYKARMAWLEKDPARLEDVRGHINNTDACSVENAIDALRAKR